MPRAVTFEVPADPTQFVAAQVRPRALLELSMQAFARWLAAHVVPYSRLLGEHRIGFVFTTVQLDYALPHLRFTDTDRLEVTGRVAVSDSAKYLRLAVDFQAPAATAARRPVGSFEANLRVVAVLEDLCLTGVPGILPEHLLARFQPEEVYRPDRAAIAAVATPPAGEPILDEVSYESTLYHSQCEVADQWSFIEVIESLAMARERIFLMDSVAPDLAKLAVRSPVRGVVAVFHRAMFVFDTCRIRTRAISSNGPDEVVFRHTVHDPAHSADCVTAWETLTSSH